MEDLTGKTVLITGATDGLGRKVAGMAAATGATLLLHGRNKAKGKALLDEIRATTGNKTLFYYNADFSSLQEVKRFSEEVVAGHTELHVLINNAAIGGGPKGPDRRELSKDGYELRFAVNYLSHFLLTQNLLPLLQKSSHSRIVHVSSIGQSPILFNDINLEKQYDSFDAYCKSKLAQIIYGFELAERLKDTGITVNSLHPATLMDTNMVHQFFGKVTKTVQEGADVVSYVAFAAETKDITGAYFNRFTQAKAAAQAYEVEARKKLWQLSESMTKAFFI